MSYVLAFYEIDRVYGGPEEGGWYFDCGNLVRAFKVTRNREHAYAMCQRANRLLDRLQRNKRDIGSVAYKGGRHWVMVHENTAPKHFPETRPHYE